jgi:hypothetical protein
MPRLLAFDIVENYLVKEYVDGPTAAQVVANGAINDQLIAQLFAMAERLRRHGLNIDYFPTNFVISENTLYYVDYEHNPYDVRWSLEEWGLYYWANASGMQRYLQSHDAGAINEDLKSGRPIKGPFEAVVRRWIAANRDLSGDD